MVSHLSHVFFGQKVRLTQSSALRQKGQSVGQSVGHSGSARSFYLARLCNWDSLPSQPDTYLEFLAPPITSRLGETSDYKGVGIGILRNC